jgi:hypothetical protein
MKDALVVEIREYWTAKWSKTSQSNNFIGYSEGRRTVSHSNAEADTIGVIIGAIEGDLLLDSRIGWLHKVM